MLTRILCTLTLLALALPVTAESMPRPDHVVIVVEENKSFAQIIGNPAAPYINQLARRGILFTRSFGVTHPSQPNYLALFSGSTHNVFGNACPQQLKGDNLAGLLMAKGMSFAGYSESMPQRGFEGCAYGPYMRKHNPASNWKELASYNLTFREFPGDFAKLPTVALVAPDQRNDMHDGSVAQGDAWLAQNIEPYAQWAMQHNSLLIVTFDEDDGSADNRVATLFVGPMVRPGISEQRIDHYSVLRTLEDMYGLGYAGNSAEVAPIKGIWRGASEK